MGEGAAGGSGASGTGRPEAAAFTLFNESPVADPAQPGADKWQAALLDQYKLYVEMSDRLGARRGSANAYFLSVNSALLALAGIVAPGGLDGGWLWLPAAAGLLLSLFWRRLIVSYQGISAAKFAVIHEIERRLPIRPWEAEWRRMGEGRDPSRYRPLSVIERGVPVLFMVLHGVLLVRAVPWRVVAAVGG